MNTEIMSELFLLHTLLNDPITYENNDKTRVVEEPAKVTTDPLSWLYKALDWLHSRTLRTRRALPST